MNDLSANFCNSVDVPVTGSSLGLHQFVFFDLVVGIFVQGLLNQVGNGQLYLYTAGRIDDTPGNKAVNRDRFIGLSFANERRHKYSNRRV